MNSLRNIAWALVLALLLVSVALAEGDKGKENTETHQNQDGTWTGTTTYPDGSKKVTDEDKDHHKTKETKYDPKGNKIEDSDWAWNGKEKVDAMRKRHIYPHGRTLEEEIEYDENGVKLKDTVTEEGYVIVDTYSGGKRIKREKVVGGKVVRTEHFDKDGNLIQHSISQAPASPVTTPSGTPQANATTQLIGLVYDKDSRPGDQVSVTLTTDPKKYQNVPALGVIEMQVAASADSTAQASLHGMVVDLGDGRKQPADQPLVIKIAQNATSIPVILSQEGSATPSAQGSVPLSQGPSPILVTDSGKASDFNTPPVINELSVIHGPLSGDAAAAHINLDSQPASIITATPRSVIFSLPSNTSPGAHTLTLQDGARTASASVVKTALIMQAGQLQLQKGQSTNYTATVLVGPLPDSVWRNGGSSLDRVNSPEASKSVPHFRVPQAGEPGVIVFRIENASRDTVTIKPSHNEVITRVLHQQDFHNGQFSHTGLIQSKKSGGFTINGTVETFFAPISCTDLTRAVAPE